jgi:hypothetical protein
MRTCAVIAHWKTPDETARCLEHLWAMEPPPDHVVVADNNSADGSARALRELAASRGATGGQSAPARNGPEGALLARPRRDGDPGAQGSLPLADAQGAASLERFALVELPENRGFAAAVNAAVLHARAKWRPLAYLIVNSDAYPASDCLAAFKADAAARPGVGIFGATLADEAGRTLQCAGGCRYLHFATMTLPAMEGLNLRDALSRPEPRLDFIHGACMFVRDTVFAAVGLFDERFFLFCEELDFCERAKRAGFHLGWTRGAVARHAGGASLRAGMPEERARKLAANYHENLGALLIAARYAGAAYPLALAWRFLGKLAVLAARGELGLAPALVAAFRDHFRR